MLFDKSKFIEQFKAETREHVQKLNEGLLKLEKNLSNKELLKEVMREAHTMKGSSTMMGFKRIADIAHRIEDGLELALQDKIILEKKHFDLIFKSLDLMEPLLEDKVVWEDIGISRPTVEGLCEELEKTFSLGEIEENKSPIKKDFQEEGSKTRSPVPSAKKESPIPLSEQKPPPHTLPEKRIPSPVGESLRVNVDKLDRLENLSEELLIAKISLNEVTRNLITKIENQGLAGNDLLPLAKSLKTVNETMTLVTSRIQNEVIKVRLVNVSHLFNIFPRTMRDLANSKGKDIEIDVHGEDAQLDKTIIDQMRDPIMHILRNAVDHGIEPPEERQAVGKPRTGKITLKAYPLGSQIVIEVSDDGRGINIEKVKEQAIHKGLVSRVKIDEMVDEQIFQFLFIPGFSTKEDVSETSGRGVGLDVVRERIANLKGMIEIQSKSNEGTKFIMKLPLTLAITESLLVSSGSEIFALPIDTVVETLRISLNEIKTVETKEALTVRGHIMPLVRLKEIFGLPEKGIIEKKYFPVVVVQSVEKKIGLLIDQLLGRQEIVRKNLGDPLKNVRDIAGATILGDGRVVLILDVPSIIESAQGTMIKRPKETSKTVSPRKKKKTILLAEDALTTATLEKNILESVGFSVVIARDGQEALEKASQEKFDLIITDVLMPRMDGFELTSRLKKNSTYKNIPVIIVTTRESDADKKRGLEAGADAYILKSEFTSEGLLDTIERLIG